MPLSLRNWANVVPAVKETVVRFPLPVIGMLGATIALMLLIHKITFFDIGLIVEKFIAIMVYGAIALTSLKLFIESKKSSTQHHVIGAIAIMAAVTLFVWTTFDDRVSMTYFLFSLAVGLSLLFAPFIKRPSGSASVWYFNYQTGVAVFFAGFAAVVLGTGVALSLVSIAYLFEIKIPTEIYADVWVVCLGLLFPIYVLANLSKVFDFQDESCQFPKGVSFITNYILVPLMFAYMAILYVYFLKIIVQWELPRGNLSWMICAFGCIGITTKLLVYPIRHSGTRLLVLFDKYFYYALIVPLILLSVAIGVRIHAYGVTEERYTVVLLGVWFLAIVLASFIKKDRFQIKHAPMILALMALLASFGPWGVVDVSIRSQVARFETLLMKHKLLVNGQAIKATGEVPFTDRKSLSSIADYLAVNEKRLKHIRPWFESLENSAHKNCKITPNSYAGGKPIVELLGLNYVNRWQRKSKSNINSFSYSLSGGFKKTAGFDFVVSGSIYACSVDTPSNERIVNLYRNGKKESVHVRCENNSLNVSTKSGEQVKLGIGQIVPKLKGKNTSSIPLADQNEVMLTQTSESGDLKVGLYLDKVYGNMKEGDKVEINGISYILLLKFND
jgi:hypothetical protein